MKTLIATFLTIASINAFATGGVHCEINDENLKVEVGGTLSRSIPSSPFSTYGSMKIKKEELKEISQKDFSGIHQYWDQNDNINMVVYKETEAAFIKLTLQTVYNSSASSVFDYEGSYTLEIYHPSKRTTLTGSAKCVLE